MKQWLGFMGICLLVSCAHSMPPPANVSIEDCNTIYQHVLKISAADILSSDLTVNHSSFENEWQAAASLLDQEYRASGKADRFFSYCLKMMNPYQVTCMRNASTMMGMTVCSKTYANLTSK